MREHLNLYERVYGRRRFLMPRWYLVKLCYLLRKGTSMFSTGNKIFALGTISGVSITVTVGAFKAQNYDFAVVVWAGGLLATVWAACLEPKG